MEQSNKPAIYGSVIQRSLISQSLANILNIAIVPINEIDESYLESGNDSFRRLVSQITGIPIDSMIDEQQYKKMTDLLSDDVFWSEIDPFHYHQRGNRSPIYFGKYKKSEEFSSQSTVLLAIHAISLMVAPVKIPVQRFMSWNTFPEFAKNRIMNQLDLETEAFELGLQCFSNALIPDRRVKEFIQAAEYYEIPSGQSPETKSDRLLNIFDKNCVKVCLAPMAFSGTASIALATQGNFIGAFLCAGTGAAISLMFIGTVSVGDLMVNYLLHKRNAIKGAETHRR